MILLQREKIFKNQKVEYYDGEETDYLDKDSVFEECNVLKTPTYVSVKGKAVLKLGGFHNRAKRDFLIKLHEQNKDKEYRHFGDIDAGGFYILEHLKRKTGIPFVSLNMDINTLEKYMEHTKTLTVNDRKRLELLLNKLECDRKVVEFMLNKDCKLEQEAVFELVK